jgi:CO/xanthine dehydrogenase Mo-binding subunit
VGKLVNEVGHRGQIEGGMAQGIGYALLEGQHYQDGQPSLHNLHEYRIPNVMDMPRFEVRLLDPVPELGITPIGEGPNCGMAAALGCAIMDAVNRPLDIPIHLEHLVSGWGARRTAAQPRSPRGANSSASFWPATTAHLTPKPFCRC